MYQKAKGKGCAELTSLSAATFSASSIHQDALFTPQATAQPTVRTAKDVVAITTLQPYAIQDPRDCPEGAGPSLLEMQAYHANEDAASPAAGTRPDAPPDAPPSGTAESLPAVPLTAVPTAPTILTETDITGDPHPFATTRRALR